MRKLIVKTALISLAGTVGAMLVFALTVILAFPMTASNWALNLGMEGASANLAARAYERSGDEEALKAAIDRAIIAEKYDILVDHCGEFLETETFSASADETVDGVVGAGPVYRDYVAGNYAVALYREGKNIDALDVIAENTAEYTDFCPARILVMEVLAAQDAEFAADLADELKDYRVCKTDEQLAARDADVAALRALAAKA